MQDLLDSAGYDDVRKIVATTRHEHDRAWRSFAVAWGAVLYRVQAAQEANDAFFSSVRVSAAPQPEERFIQEKLLFDFFASACSSVECLYFASYCIGAILDADAFPMDFPKNLRKYPHEISEAFGNSFPNERLTEVLDRTHKSDEFEALRDYRNFLSHRGSLPRHTYLGGEKDHATYVPANPLELSDRWVYEFEVTDSLTTDASKWLEMTLLDCISELRSFTRDYLSSYAA